MEQVRLLLVDDNTELRQKMAQLLRQQEGFVITGEASNGLEALEILKQKPVDVVLLDIIMPQMDGYTLMEEMQRLPLDPSPHIIAVTALGRDDFIMRAIELGARYYMVKPFEPRVLVERIREVMGQGSLRRMSGPVSAADKAHSLDERLSSLFLTIGIPAHIKGYQFLREAVKMVIDNPDIINRITKELYPGIARHFNTSASKVERAIRHAIEVAWNRGRIESLNTTFGCKVCTKEDKPTNGEFIAMIADKLGMEQRRA